MNRKLALITLVGLVPALAVAHLCNDVFVQAKDNLAVKVDIRDDQLRISGAATFRVYLLNTMDRNISNINLEVVTDDFETVVKPSPEWKSFPSLKTKRRGGKKEYFEVKLKRKPNTVQGKYKIGLKLYNGRRKSAVFKTVDIDEALARMTVPAVAAPPKVDGEATKAEWENSLLCTSLYEYKKAGGYLANCNSEVQTRFRFIHDNQSLFCLVDFQAKGKSDIARIYVAKDHESKPVVVLANLQEGTASLEGRDGPEIDAKVSGTKMEIRLPFDVLDIKGRRSFYANACREQDATTTYWRGNSASVEDPVVYANFLLQ